MSRAVRVALFVVSIGFMLIAGKAADAATSCCNPYTHLCVMMFDPTCDLDICPPTSPGDALVANPVDYRISCAARATSLTVTSGSVTIEATGGLSLY